MRIFTILLFTACVTFIIACKKTTTYDCVGVSATYTGQVKPILDAKCATSGCHNDVSKAKGIDLSNYGQTKAYAGNASFLGSIEHTGGYEPMPLNGAKLSDAEIKLIACWIKNGMIQ
jgi:mono/diheme cytochrome c family protein